MECRWAVAMIWFATQAGAADLAASSAKKQELMLHIIERFVGYAEKFHRASDLKQSRTGYYEASGPGVTQPRGAGDMAMAVVTLLTAYPNRTEFAGVLRPKLIEQTVQSIRHELFTNRLIAGNAGSWGGNEPPTSKVPNPEPGTWQGAIEAYNWGFAAMLLWNRLDEETRNLVERVITGEADLLVAKKPADARPGNTGAEDNAWNTPLVTLAATMFSKHPHAPSWKERAKLLAVNALSRKADKQSGELVDGQRVRDLVQSANLLDDYSLENHGFFNPIYEVGLHYNLTQAAVVYAHKRMPIPQAFQFRMDVVWDKVIGPLVADDGDVIMPAGQDWVAKDYQHLGYLTALGTRGRRADASVAEWRALTQVAGRQASRQDGAILGQPRLGYETTLVEMVAWSWWMHRYFGPAPQPSVREYEQAILRTAQRQQFRDLGLVMARQRDAITTMSWSQSRPMALVAPLSRGFESDPVFTAYVPLSGIGPHSKGKVTAYPCDCRDGFFSTAGKSGDRLFSMTSFSDGVTVLLTRGDGAAFPFAFERIAGITGDRKVQSGTGWVNVAGRFGMIAPNEHLLVEEKQSGNLEIPNPYLLVTTAERGAPEARGAMVLPLLSAARTSALTKHASVPHLPEGWGALLARAPDGTARLAVARWESAGATTIELSEERGAPVFSRPANIAQGKAKMPWVFDAPGSTGETARFFVTVDGVASAQALDDETAEVSNASGKAFTGSIVYVDKTSREIRAALQIAAQSRVHVRHVAGSLRISAALAGGSKEKQALILRILERFVPFSESFYRGEKGMYEAAGRGVSQARGAGDIVFANATLLAALPGRKSIGGLPRAVLLNHTIRAIRNEASTNRLIAGANGLWGGMNEETLKRHQTPLGGQAPLETFEWAFGAWVLWDRLDPATRELVKKVVIGECDILMKKEVVDALPGDTGAEDNAWNAPLLALAVVMFPADSHIAAWKDRAKLLAFNSFSRAADQHSTEQKDGRPVKDWMRSVNFHDDFTLDNHQIFNPLYIADLHAMLGEAAVFYRRGTVPVPQAFTFRMKEIWSGVMARLVTGDGDVAMPAGQDWVAKDYQHLGYYSAVATLGKMADASAAEHHALRSVAKRQAAHASGAIIGHSRLGYEATLVERIASAWWLHETFGPAPLPADTRAADTVSQFATAGLITARQRDALVTMSWRKRRPMLLVVPSSRDYADDPVFTAYVPGSGVGDASGEVRSNGCDCRTNFFSTSGTVGDRTFSATSFPDGMTMLLDRGAGSAFHFSFERIAGLTNTRTFLPVGTGQFQSNWANVDGRFALIVAGGGTMRVTEKVSSNAEVANPHTLLIGSIDSGARNRGAVVLPLVSAERTRELSRSVHQPEVPEGWSALTAASPDGELRLAIARWHGPTASSIATEDERGAPVWERETAIEGNTSRTRWEFAKPGSTGTQTRFFVQSATPVLAQLSASSIRLWQGYGPAVVKFVAADARILETCIEVGSAAVAVTQDRLHLTVHRVQ